MTDPTIEVGVVTPKEWADALGVSVQTVRAMLRSGALPSYPAGPGYGRVTTKEMFNRYFAGEHRTPPTQTAPVSFLHSRPASKAS